MKTKKCSKCGEEKLLTEFPRHRYIKGGTHPECKDCRNIRAQKYRQANKDKIIKHDTERRKTPEHKTRMRAYTLKKKYNLSLDEHQLMYILQNGKCAICKQHVDYDKIDTDHDYQTDKVRGLLCHRCNFLLAGLDDKGFYEKALKYLGRSI